MAPYTIKIALARTIQSIELKVARHSIGMKLSSVRGDSSLATLPTMRDEQRVIPKIWKRLGDA